MDVPVPVTAPIAVVNFISQPKHQLALDLEHVKLQDVSTPKQT